MNDNLFPGDYVTVVKWSANNDRSYIGDLFKILAVEGNLFQVERQEYNKDLLLFDTNQVILKRVSTKFAEKVINKDRSVSE